MPIFIVFLIFSVWLLPVDASAELQKFTNRGEVPVAVDACVEAERSGVELTEPWENIDKNDTRTRKTRIEFYYYKDNVYAFDKTEIDIWSLGRAEYYVQCFRQKRLK